MTANSTIIPYAKLLYDALGYALPHQEYVNSEKHLFSNFSLNNILLPTLQVATHLPTFCKHLHASSPVNSIPCFAFLLFQVFS